MEPRRLDSWKEIATYLGRSVTSAQRWERTESLPVHRHEHNALASVYAFTNELDDWLDQRERVGVPVPAEPDLNQVSAPLFPVPAATGGTKPSRRSLAYVAGAAIGIPVAVLAAIWGNGARKQNGSPVPHRLVANSASNGGPGISPNGEQVAYVNFENAKFRIVIRDVGSGLERTLLNSYDGVILTPRWSPDGRTILFFGCADAKNWDVFVMPADGSGSYRRITFGTTAGWTPDGKNIVVCQQHLPTDPVSVFLIDVVVGESSQVTKPPRGTWGDIAVAASPDGRHLATARYINPGNGDIWIHSFDGAPSRQLTEVKAWITGLCFSPGGDVIVFDSPIPRPGIYAVSVSGGSFPNPSRRIETGDALLPRSPDVSHSASAKPVLVFHDSPWISRLYRFAADANGKYVRTLFAPRGPGMLINQEHAVFSLDGRRIAWVAARSARSEGGTDLMIAEADGSNARSLVYTTKGIVRSLAWSPDASNVAYVATGADNSPSAWIVDVGKSSRRRITNEDFVEDQPSWSPDGRTIFVASNRDGKMRFYRLPADGSSKMIGKPVTPEAAEGFCPAKGDEFWFSTSPHGSPLWRTDLATGEVRQLFESAPPLVNRCRWRVSGNAVIYIGDGGNTRVFRRREGAPDAELVASFGFSPLSVESLAVSPDGRNIVLTLRQDNQDVWIWTDYHA